MNKKLCVLIGLAAISASAAAYSWDDGKQTWKLPNDVLGTSNQISFNQGADGVWYFMESSSLTHDPVTYKFLSKYTQSCTGVGTINGIACWSGQFELSSPSNVYLPLVGVNFTDYDQNLEFLWPRRSLVLHPLFNSFSIVAWKSPIDGFVNLQGYLTDLQTCSQGDGVTFFVDRGSSTLFTLRIAEGSGLTRFSLSRVLVKNGEILYFISSPNQNFECDSTTLNLTVTRLRGPH